MVYKERILIRFREYPNRRLPLSIQKYYKLHLCQLVTPQNKIMNGNWFIAKSSSTN